MLKMISFLSSAIRRTYSAHSSLTTFAYKAPCAHRSGSILHLSNRYYAAFNYRILKDTSDIIRHDSNISLDNIEIELDSTRLIHNLTWLRDSCHCQKCTHQASRQRMFTPRDFRKDKFVVKQVGLKKLGDVDTSSCINLTDKSEFYLYVKWIDDHESVYSIDWLKEVTDITRSPTLRLHDHSNSPIRYPQDDYYGKALIAQTKPDFWDVQSINRSLAPINFNDIMDGYDDKEARPPTYINANEIEKMSQRRFDALYSLTNQLLSTGIVKLVNVPADLYQGLRLSRSVAYERPTGYGTVFDVKVEPEDEINLAYSALEFDLHTDLPYREESPGVQLLHCLTNSESGGSSYFSDSFKAIQTLRDEYPSYFEALLRLPASFLVRDPYRNVKFRCHKQVLNLDSEGNLRETNYSPFMFPPLCHIDDLKLFYLALDKLTILLQSQENKLVTKMHPGDMFIFNNRRVLHGRSAYDTGKNNRFLQGSYMDWDEIVCLHEKLHGHAFYLSPETK